jgi:hypothetical protein
MAEPPFANKVLDYATPVPRPRRNWEGWPLASGAAYAVLTTIWLIFVCVWLLDPATRPHLDFKIVTWTIGIICTALGPPLVARGRRHHRPIWLEVSCFASRFFCCCFCSSAQYPILVFMRIREPRFCFHLNAGEEVRVKAKRQTWGSP